MPEPIAVLGRAEKVLRLHPHALARADAILAKMNPYHKPAGEGGGQFTSASGGGGGGGEIKSGTPYATKLLEARGKLGEAIRHRDALRRGGVSEADSDMINAHGAVRAAQEHVSAIEGLRRAAMAQQAAKPAEGAPAYGETKPSPAELSQRATEFLRQNETPAQAAARRAQEATQRQTDYQARERLRTSLGGAEGVTSAEAQHLQQQLDQFRTRAASQDFQSELASRTTPQKAHNLTNALLNVTGRASRAMVGLNSVISSISGASKARKAGDYAKAGMHLMHLKEDFSALKKEIAGLPKDAVALHTELTKLLASMKSALSASYSKLRR